MTVLFEALSANTRPSATPVVTFPHAGGSPRYFAPWCLSLPESLELHGMTYPGRDMLSEEAFAESVQDLAVECADAIAPLAHARPTLLFGHSLGSYVAFETARQLEGRQCPILGLVVSGADAPTIGTADTWHLASDEDLIAHVGSLDERSAAALAIPELARMFLPLIRSDYRLVETYRANEDDTVSCPVHVIYGDSDPDVAQAGIPAWEAHARGEIRIDKFRGGHFYFTPDSAGVQRYLASVVADTRKAAVT
ncbi:thioesterase II family protein [Rhodococcus sp. NPDC058521]|uniref:thioesterase II family protein n=1 Tax=Rhodococcus sp. NPDC058521 TaxID=3346536 RepID=UPI0036470021